MKIQICTKVSNFLTNDRNLDQIKFSEFIY